MLVLTSCTSDSTTTSFPETCAEAQDKAIDETGERPSNGTYTLYINADETMPWDAYCHNMRKSEPKEYLTVALGNTYSQITTPGGVTETVYRRLRIDPATLKIDLLDDTFAETNGIVTLEFFDHLPVGWAQFGTMSENGGTTAHAAIDFTNTPFVMSESVLQNDFFCISGTSGVDSDISISSDLVFVELAAGDGTPINVSKTVADCDHMGIDDEDVTTGQLPLQYVGLE